MLTFAFFYQIIAKTVDLACWNLNRLPAKQPAANWPTYTTEEHPRLSVYFACIEKLKLGENFVL